MYVNMFNPQHGYELPSSELPVGKSFATIALIVNVIVLALRLYESAHALKRTWSRAFTRPISHIIEVVVRDTIDDPRSLLLLSLCTLATIQAGIDVTFAYKSTSKNRWISHYPTYAYTAVSMYTCCFTLVSWCALWRIRTLAHTSHNTRGDNSLATVLDKQPWSLMWWYRLLGKTSVFLGPIATPLAVLITLRSLDVQAARPTATLEWRSWTIPPWALAFYATFPIVLVTLTIASYLSAFGAPLAPALLTRIRSSLHALKTSPTTMAPATSPSSSPCTSPIPMDRPLLPHTRQDGDPSALRTTAAIESMRWAYRLLTLLYTIGWIACSLLLGSIMFMFSFVTWVPLLGLVLAFLVLIESQFCKCEEDAVESGFEANGFALVQSASPMGGAMMGGIIGNDDGGRWRKEEVNEKAVLTVRVLDSRQMETDGARS